MAPPAKGPNASSQPGPVKESPLVPLLTHEKSLPRKIAKGSDAELIVEQQLMWLGAQLVIHLQILFKTLRLHDRTNAVVGHAANNLLTLIDTLAQDQPVVLRLRDDFLFLGDLHLKTTRQQFPVVMEFIDSLKAGGIGGLSFALPLQAADLCEFAELFVTFDPASSPVSHLKQQLKERGVRGIDIEEAVGRTIRVGERKKQLKLLAKSSYVKAAEAVGETLQDVREGRAPYFRRVKRVIQAIVDLMMEDEATVLGLTTLRCHDRYTHNHSVNVGLLSIALGHRARFSKANLVDLGLAGLFHDIGKAVIPLETLNKPGEFTDEEWQIIRTHPTAGVICMARLRGVTRLPGRMTAAAFEHHMHYNLSGYPTLRMRWEQSLTSRIVTIADFYDAVTSSRVYRREPVAPEKALHMMFAEAGQLFDPVLLKLLVNCVGVLPIGSLVLLDSNELAVVTRGSESQQDRGRPRVKVITDAQGNPIEGPEVDLAEIGPDGQHTRTIVRLVDNTAHRFDTGRYFV